MSVAALKNAKKVIGAKQTVKAIEKGTVSLVYIAVDAEPRVTGPIKDLCNQKKVLWEEVSSMAELGEACGIDVGAAAVAIVK